MPVFAKLCRNAAAAALFAAAMHGCALAQRMTPEPPPVPDDAQAPVLQAAPLPPPELRGTETPPLNDISNDAAPQEADDLNPVAGQSPQYGLPAPVSPTSGTINYGRPKPKKSQLYQLPKIRRPGQQQLPPLTLYATAAGMLKRGGNPPSADLTNPGPTVAVIPTLPRPLAPRPDPTPFDPVGVDVGSLRLYPYAEANIGYEANPNLLPTDVKPSAFAYGEAGTKVQSDWSQSSLAANLRAGYYDYFSVPDADRPDIEGTITGRVDVTRQTQINLQTTFAYSTEQPGSPILSIPNAVFTTNRPIYASVGQTLGVTQQFNRLSVSLNTAFGRYMFGDATQSDGTTLFLSQNDYDDYSLAGRISYELTPGLIPYLQVTGDRNQYDSPQDAYGFDRTSNGILGKIGSTFEVSQLLTGELAAGYEHRVYADPRLSPLGSPMVDASLIYSPTALTTVTFTAATNVFETTLVDASGAVGHTLSLKISHELLRNLTLSAIGTFQLNTYQGSSEIDKYYAGEFDAEYHATRTIVITGTYKYQRYDSTAALNNYFDNMFMAGLRFQL